MINYTAKDSKEYLELLEKELILKQKYELDTHLKILHLKQPDHKLVKKGASLTQLKRVVSSSTAGHDVKRTFGKIAADFVWRTLFVYYIDNFELYKKLSNTRTYDQEKEGIILTWNAIQGSSPFEKIYNEDIYSPFLLMTDLTFINDLLSKYLFINNWSLDLLDIIGDTFMIKELRAIVQGVHKNQVKDDKKTIVQLKCKIIHDLYLFVKEENNKEVVKKTLNELFLCYNIPDKKIKIFLDNIDFQKLLTLN